VADKLAMYRDRLPQKDRDELDAILRDVAAKGAEVDGGEVAKALYNARAKAVERSIPPIPAELRTLADHISSRMREYEISWDVNPANRQSTLWARRLFVAELRHVQLLVNDGMSADDAWPELRRRLAADDPTKQPPATLPPLPALPAPQQSRTESVVEEAPTADPPSPATPLRTKRNAAQPPALLEPALPRVIICGG
jgi:hypothetical protein